MFRGAIFDMDGTLALSEELHHKAFSAVFREYGVDFTFEEEVSKYAGAGSGKIFPAVFADRGISVSEEEIARAIAKKRALYDKIVRESDIPLVRGAKEFLEKLRAKGIAMIIATGNSNLDAVRLMLERGNISNFFPELVSISDVLRGKPFPDVFIEAAKRIWCDRESCIVFEDAVNGIVAAKAADMRCIAIATTSKREDLAAAGADLVVKDYTEIKDDFLFPEFLLRKAL